MASLVADYSDSDEETDKKFADQTAPRTLFYEVDSSDSSNDNVDEDDLNGVAGHEPTFTPNADRTVRDRLPHPDFGIGSVFNPVFVNPFLAEEEAKNVALERHVKMTTNAKSRQESRTINGRQVCWNYRKGRCRFGHNCKFAHDSDVSSGGSSATNVTGSGGVDQQSTRTETHGFRDNAADQGDGCGGDEPDDAANATNDKKRKKPGLSHTLVPPKRSMKAYKKQQHQEQPWLKS